MTIIDSEPTTQTRSPKGSQRNSPKKPVRKKSGSKWVLGIALLVVVAGALAYAPRLREKKNERSIETFKVARRTFSVTLNEKGELEAKNSVDVKCEVEGRSTIIWLIPEGTEVKKGDLLVKLASNEIDERIRAEQIQVQNAKASAEASAKELEITLDQNASDIRKAQLAVHNAKIELKKYVEGDSIQQRTSKVTTLDTADIRLTQAIDVEKDSLALKEKGHLSKREYERDKLALIEAKAAAASAKLDLEIFDMYTHPKVLEQKQSDVAEAEKDLIRTQKRAAATEAKQRANSAARQSEFQLISDRLAKLLEQQKKTEIHAPSAGLVVYDTGQNHWNRRQISEGAEVYERQTIIKLPDPSQMMVKLRIHEAKTSKIALGQKTFVEVEGLPGVRLTGKVSKIAPLADSQNRWLNPDLKEYATEILLDTNDHDLKPGVTARAEIQVAEIQNVLTIPIQAAFAGSGGTYAFVGANQNIAKPVKIELGESSDKYVEVSKGLSEGDTVMLSASDALLATLPTGRAKKPDNHQGHHPDGAKQAGSPKKTRGQKSKVAKNS